MTKNELLGSLSKLAKGDFLPKEWILWWKSNEVEIGKEITRNDFLKLKPLLSQSEVRATLISQSAAISILKKEGIILEQSNLYSELWNKEFNVFQKEIKIEEKIIRTKFLNEFRNLEIQFPNFFKSMAEYISTDDLIILGNERKIEILREKKLPFEILEFAANISTLKIEGFDFDVNEIQPINIKSIPYIHIGKLNLHSDGDSIILKVSDTIESTIYYLNHSKKNEIIEIAKDFKTFIEKVLVEFMKEQQ